MDDKISRNEVLTILEIWIDYYKQILAKCEELGSKELTYIYAKNKIELLSYLMVEIKEL